MTVPQRCTGLQICISYVILRHFHRSLSDNSCQNKPRRSFGGRGVGTQKPTVLYNHEVHARVQLLCRPVSGTTELSMMWTQSFPNIKYLPHGQILLCEPASENWSAVQVRGTVGNTGSVIMSNHREDVSSPVQNMFFSFLFLFYWNSQIYSGIQLFSWKIP